MYEDVIRATAGVDYFFVSTDAVYYAGLCSQCARPYNPENRSLEFVDFVNKTHDFLAKRGRKMLIWAEFPLLPEHVKLLPPESSMGKRHSTRRKVSAESADWPTSPCRARNCCFRIT